MSRILTLLLLCGCLAAVAGADGVLIVTQTSSDESKYYIGCIQLNFLDAGQVAQWLGGTSLDLGVRTNPSRNPSYYPQQYQPYPPYGAPQQLQQNPTPYSNPPVQQTGRGRLNPNAPLRNFVPDRIENVVGFNN